MRCAPWLLLLAASCTPQPVVRAETEPKAISERPTLYVDERALDDGDGTAAKPFRSLKIALQRAENAPTVIELGSGLYEGPFELGPGMTLRGRGGAVVLHSNAEVTVTGKDATFERVMIQGGQVGLRAEGKTRLDRVELSGQRKTAVDVASGELVASEVKFEASVSEIVGLALQVGASAKLTSSKWQGPYRRGIEQFGGTLSLDGARFDDSVIAVHVRAGAAEIKDARVRGGREAAFLVSEAKVSIEASAVNGHEYGLLAGQGADVSLKDFQVTGSERAGVAFTQAKGDVSGLEVHDGGSYAGVQLVRSEVSLRNVKITKATSAGVLINGGKVSITSATISGSRNADGSSGDGIAAREGAVQLTAVHVTQAEGAGVLSGNAAEVTVTGVMVDGALHGALVADFKGKLTATKVSVRNVREAAFVAIEGATMSVDGARVESAPDGLAWVECASGATLQLRSVQSPVAAPPSACIDVRSP